MPRGGCPRLEGEEYGEKLLHGKSSSLQSDGNISGIDKVGKDFNIEHVLNPTELITLM